MAVEFRSYRDSDRDSLFEITSDAWSVFGPSSEMHIGDLSWALLQTGERTQRIRLAHENGRLIGFAFFTSPRWCDFVLRPGLVDSTVEAVVEEFAGWADLFASSIRLSGSTSRLLRFGRRISDPVIVEQIESIGFRRMESGFPTLHRPVALEETVSNPPPGFEIVVAGSVPAESRRAAWKSAFPNEGLNPGFFSELPQTYGANPELDLPIVDPDKIVAAFLTVWHDKSTRSALFEPVGCNAGFRRMGLTRILVEEACRRLDTLRTESAFVRVSNTDPAAKSFYVACGFVVASREFGFERSL